MLIGYCAAFTMAALSVHAPNTPHAIGAHDARDALLAEPAPVPPHRTTSHHAPWNRNSYVSVSHTHQGAQPREQLHAPTATYGADPHHADARPLARINHQSLAIDPWTPIEGLGSLARLENARNQWLREQGYIEKVRTHTNPRPFDPRLEERSDNLPAPRGILEVTPAKPNRLRVDASPR